MYTFDSLNRLQESLEATNVLSKDYRLTVMSWALAVASEASEHAEKRTLKRWLKRDQVWRRKSDGKHALVNQVCPVRKPSPAWDSGRRDHVVLDLGGDQEIEVNQDDLVENWTRYS